MNRSPGEGSYFRGMLDRADQDERVKLIWTWLCAGRCMLRAAGDAGEIIAGGEIIRLRPEDFDKMLLDGMIECGRPLQ